MRSTKDSNRLYLDVDGRSSICELVGLVPVLSRSPSLAYESALAMQLAVKHLNEGNGILVPEVAGLDLTCPITFSTSVTDTKYNPTYAFSVVDELTESNDTNRSDATTISPNDGYASPFEWRPCAFVGATGSSISKTTSMINGLRGIPQVSPASTNVELNDKANYKTFARTIPDDDAMAEAYIRFFYEALEARHLFVLVEPGSFNRAVVKSLRKAVVKLGLSPGQNITFANSTQGIGSKTNAMHIEEHLIERVFAKPYREENTSDEDLLQSEGLIFDAIQALKASEFRFVLVLANLGTVTYFMERAQEQGLAGDGTHQYFFYETKNLEYIASEDEYNLAKAYNGTGFIYQTLDREGERQKRFVQESIELKQELHQKYGDKHNTTPYLGLFKPSDGAKVFNESDWLVDDYVNKKPLFAYDATILLGLSACHEVNSSSMVLKGGDYFERILRTNFTGVTGEVVLDPETGSRKGNSVQYAIDNILSFEKNTFKQIQTYVLKPGSEERWHTAEPYIFNGNKTIEMLGPTPDLPPIVINENTVGLWVLIVAYGLLVTILGATFGFAIWTFRHWDSRVVKASQPHFLLLICFGIAIMALSIIPLSLEHLDVVEPAMPCTTIWWFAVIGFGITFSTLFAKTYRINKIVASSIKCRRIQLSIRETLYPVVGILCFNVIMLSLMTKFGPVTYETVGTKFDRFHRTIELYGQCTYSRAFAFLIPTVVINFGMVVLALIQAWRARYLSTEFAESKSIANALLISFLVVLFAIPVLNLTQENPSVDTFINTIIVSIITGNTLCFLFVPKIVFLRKEKRGQSEVPSIAKTIFARASVRLIKTNFSSNPTTTSSSRNTSNNTSATTRDVSSGSDHSPSSQQPSEEVGEKILTTKTQEELASEVSKLLLSLETVQRENADLKKRLLEYKPTGETKRTVNSNPSIEVLEVLTEEPLESN